MVNKTDGAFAFMALDRTQVHLWNLIESPLTQFLVCAGPPMENRCILEKCHSEILNYLTWKSRTLLNNCHTTSGKLWLDLLMWTHPFSDTISKQGLISVLKIPLSGNISCFVRKVMLPTRDVSFPMNHLCTHAVQDSPAMTTCLCMQRGRKKVGTQQVFLSSLLIREVLAHWGSSLWDYYFVALLYVGERGKEGQ